jgi:hypothetical protein
MGKFAHDRYAFYAVFEGQPHHIARQQKVAAPADDQGGSLPKAVQGLEVVKMAHFHKSVRGGDDAKSVVGEQGYIFGDVHKTSFGVKDNQLFEGPKLCPFCKGLALGKESFS